MFYILTILVWRNVSYAKLIKSAKCLVKTTIFIVLKVVGNQINLGINPDTATTTSGIPIVSYLLTPLIT